MTDGSGKMSSLSSGRTPILAQKEKAVFPPLDRDAVYSDDVRTGLDHVGR